MLYDDLDADGAIRLACKHLNRGQEIPAELMAVLEEYEIAYYFQEDTSEIDAEATATAGA